MPKILKGDYVITKVDDNKEVISFIVQKTKEEATLYLFPVVKEILKKYEQKGFKYIDLLVGDERSFKSNEIKLNRAIKKTCQKAGLDSDINYIEQIGKDVVGKKKKLFELIHTQTARHTFITLMCRLGVPKEDVIIATAHTDTTMIDDVYLHETINDKGKRLVNSLSQIKGSTFFKIDEQADYNQASNSISLLKESNFNGNDTVSNIIKGLELQLNQIQHSIDEIKVVTDNIKVHKATINPDNTDTIIKMVFSLFVDGVPLQSINNMMEVAGLLHSNNDIMTTTSYIMTKE